MVRPIDNAPPEQASSNAPGEVQLPAPMPLPDPDGAPSLSVPVFSPLNPPSEADAGIAIAAVEMPDLPDFFGF
jgi:hypothetical protein